MIFAIVYPYDKLKIVWAGYDANPESLAISRFLPFSECYTMGMCHIGVILGFILCLELNLKRLEGLFCGRNDMIILNKIMSWPYIGCTL